MQKLQKEYSKKGVVWLSIVSCAPGKQGFLTAELARKTKSEKGSRAFAILMDTDGKVGKSYSAKTTPYMFVIGPDGKFVYTGAIDSTPSTNPDDIKESKNYV